MSAQAKPDLPAPKKPQVIYVMGAGRSGSTIFGVALGNCTDIFDAGEMEAWLRRSGVPNFDGADRLNFWAGVRNQVGGADLYGDRAWLSLEHSSSLLRIDRWATRRRLRHRYRQIMEDLYRAIMDASGQPVMVDTSHYPLRVRELQALEGINLYLIYLVRDPHSVVASFNRRDVNQPSKSPVGTNLYLWATHLLSIFIFHRQPAHRRLLVRYEDFVANPQEMLREILGSIGVSDVPPDLSSLKTGIPFQGNRLLTSEVLPLRSDTGPRPTKHVVTTLLQSPWTFIHTTLHPTAGSSTPSK